VYAREAFVRDAVSAGYKADAVFRIPIRQYILRRLRDRRYQEKQVDTAVVALLVRSAIEKPRDFHVVITGDSDILPAVKVAYPEYTKNVIIATTHPDQLAIAHRQTSFSLLGFDFEIPPFFLTENAQKLLKGDHVHKCAECGKVFATQGALPRMARPYCRNHHQVR
jgi:hypothetical protein